MACVWQRMLLSPRSYSQRLYGMLERQRQAATLRLHLDVGRGQRDGEVGDGAWRHKQLSSRKLEYVHSSLEL